MLVTERLDVSHNFVTIDSPIKFFLEINGDVKTRVLKSSQAIQIDCRKLLTKKDMPNFPAWTLSLIYDDSLLAPGEKVNWYPHDVDFAGSQDSVNGQLVDVDLSGLYAELTQNNANLIDSVGTVKSSVDDVKGVVESVSDIISPAEHVVFTSLVSSVGGKPKDVWKARFTPTPDVLDSISRPFICNRYCQFIGSINRDAGSDNSYTERFWVSIPPNQVFWVALDMDSEGWLYGLHIRLRGADYRRQINSTSEYIPNSFDEIYRRDGHTDIMADVWFDY